MTTLEKPKTTVHTHVANDGTVVIIRDVPIRVRFDADGIEQIRYSLSVAQRLDKLIEESIVSNRSNENTLQISYAQDIVVPDVDIELKVKGEGVNYGQATVRVWKKTFDRIHSALSTLQRSLAEFYGIKIPGGFPVGYATQGSLLIGLRKNEANDLFEINERDVNAQTLDLILEVSEWLGSDGKDAPTLLKENPKLFDSALRAVEELSPTNRDDISSVEISDKRSFSRTRPISLTPSTRDKALLKRVEAAIESGNGQRQVLSGVIYQVNINGGVRIRNIYDSEPLIKTKTIIAQVNENLLSQVLDAMKNKEVVRMEGVLKPPKKGQKKYEIVDVQEIPNLDQ